MTGSAGEADPEVTAAGRRAAGRLVWVRPLEPGHPSTGSPLPAGIVECTLNRITRHATEVTSWVARYHGSAPILKKDGWPKGARLNQKTRSITYEDKASEHDAFRETLLWLWRRHEIHRPLGSGEILPEHVVRALAPRENGKLAPCPACLAGTCDFMEKAPIWLGSLVGDASSAAKPPSAAAVPSAPKPSKQANSTGAAAPGATKERCITCGGDDGQKVGDLCLCRSCRAIDERATGALAVGALRLKSTKAGAINLDEGPGWQRIRVPGDGDCMFTALTLCRMLAMGKAVPPFEQRAGWGQACRRRYLAGMKLRLDVGREYMGCPIRTLILASTGLEPDEYLVRMSVGSTADRRTWGGFLELSMLAQRWWCRVHVFRVVGRDLALMCSIGMLPHSVPAQCKWGGHCAVLWRGGHWDTLRVSAEVQRKLDNDPS